MAVIENQIETKLTSAFQPAFLDVENESHKHNVLRVQNPISE